MGAFSVNEAIGQAAGAALREQAAGQTSPNTEQPPTAPKDAGARQPPPGGNPLWGIPIGTLDATRERPIFSASRRPPMPPVVAQRMAAAPPPPKPAEPEHPLLTLVGTAIGKSKNVAVVLDRTTKTLVRLHVGETVSGWILRSVDSRTMTVEKSSQTVTLALPAPGSAPLNPLPVSEASGTDREF
ncbi:MAG: general secretion pathway protein GspN [Hyphomicrobiales bacterium]|nr:MAG: general secretion pathway protein GspN [Hyphomicrobiales bacterium]